MNGLTEVAPTRTRSAAWWAGQVASAVAVVFLLLDGLIHVLRVHQVLQSFHDLGYPTDLARPLGIIELGCVALYLVSRTSGVGALLLTGYLGGAVSAHARLEDPLFSTTLFPVYLGVALWAGLWAREPRLRTWLRPVD